MFGFRLAATAFAAAMVVTSVFAAAAEPEPLQRSNATAVWFENWGSLYNAKLTVKTPDGTIMDLFAAAGTPTFYLRDASPVVDGVYQYELSAATTETVKIKNPVDQGRGDAEKSEIAKPYYMTGTFVVSRGVITVPEALVEN